MPSEYLTIDQFYEQGRAGRLLGLKCAAGHVTVPPRRSCRVCQSLNMQIAELSKSGNVVSFTEVYVKSKDFPLDTPYILALVKLDEGGNLLGVIDGQASKLMIGSKVSVIFKDAGEKVRWPRVFFELV